MQRPTLGFAFLLAFGGLAAAAAPAGAQVHECSTPDPRNAYDYCIESFEQAASVRVLEVGRVGFTSPFCLPVPVLGPVCPPVPDLSPLPVGFDVVPATLTRLQADGSVHASATWEALCELYVQPFVPKISCKVNLADPGFHQSKGLALVDFEDDGTYDGLALGIPVTAQACPILYDCGSFVWFYVGVR